MRKPPMKRESPPSSIPDFAEGILVDIPNSAKIVETIELKVVTLEILQCPYDKSRKTGLYFVHMHSDNLDECCAVQVRITEEELTPKVLVQTGMELYSFFCNYVMYRRDEDGERVH